MGLTAFYLNWIFGAVGDMDVSLAIIDLISTTDNQNARFELGMLYDSNSIAGLVGCLGLVLAPVFLNKPLPYALETTSKKLLFIFLGYLVGVLSYQLPIDPGWYSVVIVAVGWPKIVYGLMQTSNVLGKAIDLVRAQNQSPSHG